MKMTEELIRVHAHVCGDGWLYSGLRKRSKWDIKKYNRSRELCKEWHIGYSNKQISLLKEFKNDIRKILPHAYIEERNDEVRVRSKSLFNQLKVLGANSSKLWFINNQILNASKEIRIEWTRAFFDDEATVENSNGHKRIRIKSVNRKGLFNVQNILTSIKIESNLTGPNSDNTWYLTISKLRDLIRFYVLIKLIHPKREYELEQIIKNAPAGI